VLRHTKKRGLGPDILILPIFAGCVRVDRRNKVLFSHSGAVVLLAFDNDQGEEKIAAEINMVAPAGREIRRVLLDKKSGKDWNDILKCRLGLGYWPENREGSGLR
jgi:hypothetical protein